MSQFKSGSSDSPLLPNFNSPLNLNSKKQLVQQFANAKGTNLFTRYYPAEEFITSLEKNQLWLQKRQLLSAPLPQTTIKDPQGKQHRGLNFASNNYLGLAKHPFTIEAGIQAAKEFGVNSAGSPLAFGATKYYVQLKNEIGDFLNSDALIFSSGWLACFGFIKAIIKDYDCALIDELADPALFEGAHYTTRKVHTFKHLDQQDLRSKLKELRKTQQNGILVITDALFGVDSSSPNLVKMQKITEEYEAFLVINTGHDFGVIGAEGKGVWEQQGLTNVQNTFFIGSGSKTLGVNYGFIALPGKKGGKDSIYIDYWKYFCSTYMFTNAINPIQSNAGLATLRIARSYLGKQLRDKVLQNGKYLRQQLTKKGHKVLGRVSPFVCVRVGSEGEARIIAKILMTNDIFVNVVQYPSVNVGEAVVRFSLTPDHTKQQMDKLTSVFDWSAKKAKQIVSAESSKTAQCPAAKL